MSGIFHAEIQNPNLKEYDNMAVFRVHKDKNYTVMSNHHFRNRELTLKAMGLLSLMLNLPDSWDYSLKGLATICGDGLSSVRAGLVELENHGYVKRERMRDAHGRLANTEYSIFESPQKQQTASATTTNNP